MGDKRKLDFYVAKSLNNGNIQLSQEIQMRRVFKNNNIFDGCFVVKS